MNEKERREMRDELKAKYQLGYTTYDRAVASVNKMSEEGLALHEDTPITWWAARHATRAVVSEVAEWIRVTFDMTDDQKTELHALMCHVGSD